MGREHINVMETRAALKVLPVEDEASPGQRHMFLLDSRVAAGALSKGRSASAALNREVRRALPWVLGADYYPGFSCVPTRLNVSDDPTRGRAVRKPRCAAPVWYGADPAPDPAWEAWASLPTQPRTVSERARLTFKLWLKLCGPERFFAGDPALPLC